MNDKNLISIISEANKSLNLYTKHIEAERINSIIQDNFKFNIRLEYISILSDQNIHAETITIEGFQNSLELFKTYYSIARNIKLKSLTISGKKNNVKIKKINFKYKNGCEKW